MTVSKFQDDVKQVIREIFKSIKIEEEANAKTLLESWTSPYERFDLVLPTLKLIIECHGQQHFSFSTFGEKNKETAFVSFQDQKRRDFQKKNTAIEEGWGYAEIKYKRFYRKRNGGKDYVWKEIERALS